MKKYCAMRDIMRAVLVNGGIRTYFDPIYLQKRQIVLYGASEIADIILKLCQKERLKIDGICDKKVYSNGWKYMDYPIINLETLRNRSDIVVIITAVGFENEIKEILGDYCIGTIMTIEEVFRV